MNNARQILPVLRWEPPPIYFLHIGKTAGTSMRQILRQNYRRSDVLDIDIPTLYSIALAELQTKRCYLSQLGLGMYQLVRQGQMPAITVLRDPVERSISMLYFHMKQLQRVPHEFAPDYLEHMQPLVSAGLKAWLQDPLLIRRTQDAQTCALGIVYDYRPYLKDGEIGSSGTPVLGPLTAPALSEAHNMNQVFDRARRELERMMVVGLTERFAESAEMVCALLGIPAPAQAPQRNIGPRKTGVDLRGYRASTPPELVEQVEALTRYDRELYACACDLFEQQWARHRANPRRSYSIAPRLRAWGQRGIKAVWPWVRRVLPGLDNWPAVQRLKRKVKG